MSLVMSVRFDGEILSNAHYISLRTASKVFGHLQRAMDRAHLEALGRLYKHARLGNESYRDHVIWLGDSRPNCRTFDILASENDKQIIRRVRDAWGTAMGNLVQNDIAREQMSLKEEREQYLARVNGGFLQPEAYPQFRRQQDHFEHKFSERAITKELVEIGSVVRSDGAGENSCITINTHFDDNISIELNRHTAKLLSQLVGVKRLAPPVLYAGEYRGGDIYTKTGKFKNALTANTMLIKFQSKDDAIFLNGFSGQVISIVCCPVLEYDTHDVECGDIYFLKKL